MSAVAGDRGAALPQRPRLAENLRAVLRVEDQEHHQQHGHQVAPAPQHDFHLERDIVP